MENTKYKYITLKVETKAEYLKAKKMISLGYVPFNFIGDNIVQLIKAL